MNDSKNSQVKLALISPKSNDCQHTQLKEYPDSPGGKGLEDLVTYIASEMAPCAYRPPYDLQDLAWKFTKFTDLRDIPIRKHLDRLLDMLGIAWVAHGQSFEPTFFYNEANKRWEIHTPGLDDAWTSVKIIHEVFEIVCWRCQHRIYWWKKWAASQGLTDPHKKAEAFAFLVVLPNGKFRGMAKKLKYDMWALAGICQVPPHLCFRAINEHVGLPYPMFHAQLRFGVALPDQPPGLFDDAPIESQAQVKRKAYKVRRKDGQIDWSDLDAEEWLRWSAVGDMEKFSAKDAYISMGLDDVVETARKRSGFVVTKARRVAGMPLGSIATVIVRTPERSIDSVYFQVIPSGYEATHLSYNGYEELL